MSYQPEEEQLAALGRAWKKYGNFILLVVVLLVAGFYGYRLWNNHLNAQAREAANLYSQIEDMAGNTLAAGKALDEKQNATFLHLTALLEKEHGHSIYAAYAGLLMARQAVLTGKAEAAKAALQRVMKTSPDPQLGRIAALRMATVFAGEGKTGAKQALDLLERPGMQKSFPVLSADIRGDAYTVLDDTARARQAYDVALKAAAAQGQERPLIKMKRDNLTG